MSETELETEEEVEEAADAEPEPEPELDEQTPEEAAAAEGSQEIARKLERENERHVKAVSKILGQNMDEHLCPTCDGFGFADEQQKAAAESALPADFVHPDEYQTCRDCHGYGEILSGSKNPQHAVVTCTKCSGLGYKIEAVHPPAAPVYTLPTPQEAQPLNGVYVPGRGFIPYGETEPIPGSAG